MKKQTVIIILILAMSLTYCSKKKTPRQITVKQYGFTVAKGKVISRLNPVKGANVEFLTIKGKSIAKVQTDTEGIFNVPFKKLPYKVCLVRVSLAGYSSLIRTINFKDKTKEILFSIKKASIIKLNKGQAKTLKDKKRNFSLYVHADIVKRIDGKPVKYPIFVQASYTNSGLGMPGRDMLSTNPETGEVMPLSTAGAVNIEAYDSENASLRLDRNKAKKLGVTTKLIIKVKRKHKKHFKKLKLWKYDYKNGNLMWNRINNKIKLSYNRSSNLDVAYLLRRNTTRVYYEECQEEADSTGLSQGSNNQNYNMESGIEAAAAEGRPMTAQERRAWQTRWNKKRVRRIARNFHVSVSNVDLVLINLDYPHQAVPVMLRLATTRLDKRYLFIIKTLYTYGSYTITRTFYGKDREASFKVLLPGKTKIRVNVIEYVPGQKLKSLFLKYIKNQRIVGIVKTYNIPAAKMKYRKGYWGKIVRMDGKPVRYSLLDTINL